MPTRAPNDPCKLMHPDRSRLVQLTPILKGVSRSFYLTLRVLPAAIRPQVGLAYLIARLTDTIADTDAVPVEQRISLLQQMRERVLNGKTLPDFEAIQNQQVLPAEVELLHQHKAVFQLFDHCSEQDQKRMRQLMDVIISGQELDLQRFGAAFRDQIQALETRQELDDYAYRVAGCVGVFWTHMCLDHGLLPSSPADQEWLDLGVQFGKGLQYTNILRDIPKDLSIGRCYVPKIDLAQIGLQPRQLLSPDCYPAFKPLYMQLLDITSAYLGAGWQYTLKIPRSCIRLRLACAWPILIGVQTIQRLRSANVLDPSLRVKVSRHDVKKIVFKSLLLYPFKRTWQRLGR